MYLLVLPSCSIMGLQKMGAKSSGLAGLPVPGFSGGWSSPISAARLYHCFGISSGSRVMRTSFGIAIDESDWVVVYVHIEDIVYINVQYRRDRRSPR